MLLTIHKSWKIRFDELYHIWGILTDFWKRFLCFSPSVYCLKSFHPSEGKQLPWNECSSFSDFEIKTLKPEDLPVNSRVRLKLLLFYLNSDFWFWFNICLPHFKIHCISGGIKRVDNFLSSTVLSLISTANPAATSSTFQVESSLKKWLR